MSNQSLTNWLLLGILIVLAAHLFEKGENLALADTFRLDDCITARITDTPSQYLHVVVHASPKSN